MRYLIDIFFFPSDDDKFPFYQNQGLELIEN